MPIPTGVRGVAGPNRAVARATGCAVALADLVREDRLAVATHFGASPAAAPAVNARAIDQAIAQTAERGGGTVVIPAGVYSTYTIHLASGVNLLVERGAVLRAALPGPGGNVDEPEVNPWVGLQDHAHTYLANSLLFGADLERVAIYGPGRIDGAIPQGPGRERQALRAEDPLEPTRRGGRGHRGGWWGTHAVALLRCRRVVLSGFEVARGGHIAVLATGARDLLVDRLTIDTNRDGVDLDCCEDATVRACRINAPNDDAIAIKASWALGRPAPSRNVLVEDCTVSGYDVGSLMGGASRAEVPVAPDGDGPCAGVRIGSESAGGFERITVRGVRFERSRGVALESVDGAVARDVAVEHCRMRDVWGPPLFLRLGDRARVPVTGTTANTHVVRSSGVRLDDPQWVVPNSAEFGAHPAARYAPAYDRSRFVDVGDSGHPVAVVNPEHPLRPNPANARDPARHLDAREAAARGDAIGAPSVAALGHVEVRDLVARDVDPRGALVVAGLVDAPIEDVALRRVLVTFRGGLTPRDAAEQRQVFTRWRGPAGAGGPREVRRVPWLVNPLSATHEAQLPRVRWHDGEWVPDPCNVPEQAPAKPESTMFGILPAYGLYARHVRGLRVHGLRLRFEEPDLRPAVVLDDVAAASFSRTHALAAPGVAQFALVENPWARPSGREYVPGEPYRTTRVERVDLPADSLVVRVSLRAPAPGTPPDVYWAQPTIAGAETGFAVRDRRRLPPTVFLHRRGRRARSPRRADDRN